MDPIAGNDIKRERRRHFSDLSNIPEIMAISIISKEGLPIASALPQGLDETRIAAITAANLSLAEELVIEMDNGDFDQLCIKGSNGYILLLKAGSNAVLTVSTTKMSNMRFELISSDCKRICEKIANLI